MGETNRRERVLKDAKVIDNAMKHYTGNEGAHFGFITFETGERQFFAGGRVDLSGMCMCEALATMVVNTPGLEVDFIDAVADTAKIMLEEMKKGRTVQ